MTDISKYTGMLARQHADKPKLNAVAAAICQPFVDLQNQLSRLWYDLDTATGAQLDAIAEIVGATRTVNVTLTGIYFALDTPGAGFDQAVWKASGDPTYGALLLQDPEYRLILKAKILNNHWDGSIPKAYELMNSALATWGYSIGIRDNGNLTMDQYLRGGGTEPDVLIWALFTNGYFDIRPATVGVNQYAYGVYWYEQVVEEAVAGGFTTTGASAFSVVREELLTPLSAEVAARNLVGTASASYVGGSVTNRTVATGAYWDDSASMRAAAGFEVRHVHWNSSWGVFIAVGGGGALKSTDGVNWSTAGNFTTAFGAILALKCFSDGSTIYVVGMTSKIVKSTDGGTTWSGVNIAGLTAAIGSRVLYAGLAKGSALIVAGAAGKCGYSLNGGTTWSNDASFTAAMNSNVAYDFAEEVSGGGLLVVGAGGSLARAGAVGSAWLRNGSFTTLVGATSTISSASAKSFDGLANMAGYGTFVGVTSTNTPIVVRDHNGQGAAGNFNSSHLDTTLTAALSAAGISPGPVRTSCHAKWNGSTYGQLVIAGGGILSGFVAVLKDPAVGWEIQTRFPLVASTYSPQGVAYRRAYPSDMLCVVRSEAAVGSSSYSSVPNT